MGNFSNDPQVRLTDAVSKHYIAVRMQQSVPLLDADWNLLEDLRRQELETLGTWFIGSGVPVGSDGFAIFPTAAPNDFAVRGGLCIAGGKLTVNPADTTYATQPNFGNPAVVPPLTPLTTPAADKSFIVYLDVWEHEIDSQADPAMVDPRIGLETAIRLKRDWVVRVARVPEDLPVLNSPPPGHVFLQLAQLDRKGGNANITAAMITELRETQLSVSRRIEVRDNAGTIVVNNARFVQMLKDTRNNVLAFSTYLTTVFNAPSTSLSAGEILGLQAIEVIAHAADSGLALVNTHSIANPGAVQYLFQLYDAQDHFVSLWQNVVLQLGGSNKKYAGYKLFITQLDHLLHDPLIGPLTGLQPALQASNLAAAVTTQEQIASLFSTAGSASVPHGGINVILANSPPGNLTITGQPVRFEFKAKSATTLAGTYTVSVLPAAGWPRLAVTSNGNPIPNNKITIPPAPGETSILVDVTVQPGSTGLQLRVTSDANPAEIDQLSNLFTLTQGQPAPLGEDKIQFRISNLSNGSIDPASGAVNITRTQKCTITVQVTNNTGQSPPAPGFTLGVTKNGETPAGTWTLNYKGDPTTPIPNGGFVSEQMDITPSATATSVQLVFTVSASIGGSQVTGIFNIVCAAV